MNHYEIINEYNGKIKYDFLPKIIDKCLEMEHVENAIFSIIFIDDEKMHELNKTYHLKFIYNEKTITYYYDNEEKGSALINAPVSGAYCGIQLDHSGVTISNIKFN